MFHIQTLNKISPVGLNKFDPANYTVDAPETTPEIGRASCRERV